jgi:N utilization substance protein A
MFIDALDVDDVIAHLLVTEGFTEIEEVAFVPLEDLSTIEGFSEEVANELSERARTYLSKVDEEYADKAKELGIAEDLMKFEGLKPNLISLVGEKGVKTLDDLADLAGDELIEMLPPGSLTADEANDVIMAARAHWFEDEEAPNGDDASDGDSEESADSGNKDA